MSKVYCWECKKEYHKDEVLDIPVFSKAGYNIQWCFNCVNKQLRIVNKIIKKRKSFWDIFY